jgi:outer membrane protein TolC
MVASRSMVAMLVGALGIACAGSGMSASHAMAHPRLERAEGPPAESAPRASARPWWLAFESETLNTLIAEAGRNAASAASANSAERLDAPAVEIGVSASYVALLAHTLGLTYIDSARAAARRQSQLIAASPAPHDDFSRELTRREAGATASMKKIEVQREAQLAFLAARSSLPEEKLQKAIDDEVAARKQPRFALPLPEALPAVLLANRDDIQLAAALYGIDPQTRLDGTIDAAEEDPDEGDRVAGADLSGYPLFSDAMAQGRAEVSGALRKLQAASAAAADANRRAREAKGLFEESKTRMSRGEMSEIQVLEDYQGLMLDLQRLTVSNGNLAIAWITLMASLGSRTPLVLHAPHAPAAAGLGGRSRLVGAFAF